MQEAQNQSPSVIPANEPGSRQSPTPSPKQAKSKTWLWALLGVAALLVVGAGVYLGQGGLFKGATVTGSIVDPKFTDDLKSKRFSLETADLDAIKAYYTQKLAYDKSQKTAIIGTVKDIASTDIGLSAPENSGIAIAADGSITIDRNALYNVNAAFIQTGLLEAVKLSPVSQTYQSSDFGFSNSLIGFVYSFAENKFASYQFETSLTAPAAGTLNFNGCGNFTETTINVAQGDNLFTLNYTAARIGNASCKIEFQNADSSLAAIDVTDKFLAEVSTAEQNTLDLVSNFSNGISVVANNSDPTNSDVTFISPFAGKLKFGCTIDGQIEATLTKDLSYTFTGQNDANSTCDFVATSSDQAAIFTLGNVFVREPAAFLPRANAALLPVAHAVDSCDDITASIDNSGIIIFTFTPTNPEVDVTNCSVTVTGSNPSLTLTVSTTNSDLICNDLSALFPNTAYPTSDAPDGRTIRAYAPDPTSNTGSWFDNLDFTIPLPAVPPQCYADVNYELSGVKSDSSAITPVKGLVTDFHLNGQYEGFPADLRVKILNNGQEALPAGSFYLDTYDQTNNHLYQFHFLMVDPLVVKQNSIDLNAAATSNLDFTYNIINKSTEINSENLNLQTTDLNKVVQTFFEKSGADVMTNLININLVGVNPASPSTITPDGNGISSATVSQDVLALYNNNQANFTTVLLEAQNLQLSINIEGKDAPSTIGGYHTLSAKRIIPLTLPSAPATPVVNVGPTGGAISALAGDTKAKLGTISMQNTSNKDVVLTKAAVFVKYLDTQSNTWEYNGVNEYIKPTKFTFYSNVGSTITKVGNDATPTILNTNAEYNLESSSLNITVPAGEYIFMDILGDVPITAPVNTKVAFYVKPQNNSFQFTESGVSFNGTSDSSFPSNVINYLITGAPQPATAITLDQQKPLVNIIGHGKGQKLTAFEIQNTTNGEIMFNGGKIYLKATDNIAPWDANLAKINTYINGSQSLYYTLIDSDNKNLLGANSYKGVSVQVEGNEIMLNISGFGSPKIPSKKRATLTIYGDVLPGALEGSKFAFYLKQNSFQITDAVASLPTIMTTEAANIEPLNTNVYRQITHKGLEAQFVSGANPSTIQMKQTNTKVWTFKIKNTTTEALDVRKINLSGLISDKAIGGYLPGSLQSTKDGKLNQILNKVQLTTSGKSNMNTQLADNGSMTFDINTWDMSINAGQTSSEISLIVDTSDVSVQTDTHFTFQVQNMEVWSLPSPSQIVFPVIMNNPGINPYLLPASDASVTSILKTCLDVSGIVLVPISHTYNIGATPTALSSDLKFQTTKGPSLDFESFCESSSQLLIGKDGPGFTLTGPNGLALFGKMTMSQQGPQTQSFFNGFLEFKVDTNTQTLALVFHPENKPSSAELTAGSYIVQMVQAKSDIQMPPTYSAGDKVSGGTITLNVKAAAQGAPSGGNVTNVTNIYNYYNTTTGSSGAVINPCIVNGQVVPGTDKSSPYCVANANLVQSGLFKVPDVAPSTELVRYSAGLGIKRALDLSGATFRTSTRQLTYFADYDDFSAESAAQLADFTAVVKFNVLKGDGFKNLRPLEQMNYAEFFAAFTQAMESVTGKTYAPKTALVPKFIDCQDSQQAWLCKGYSLAREFGFIKAGQDFQNMSQYLSPATRADLAVFLNNMSTAKLKTFIAGIK